MSTRRVRMTTPDGPLELELTDELARELEREIRSLRRPPQRDYPAEIERYLRQAGSAHTTEIARAIHARDENVRRTLASDSRFLQCPAPRGASGRPIWWTLARDVGELVPEHGTTYRTAGRA